MARKLFAFVDGQIDEDNVDVATHHEILTCASIFAPLFSHQLGWALYGVSRALQKKKAKYPHEASVASFFTARDAISQSFARFLATGNLNAKISGTFHFLWFFFYYFFAFVLFLLLKLFYSIIHFCCLFAFVFTGSLSHLLEFKQLSGYSIVAERLNYIRYLAHYRSVHRGTFFQDLQTTTVRKVLID
jgi:DNA-directed RNA polymerase beta subunit